MIFSAIQCITSSDFERNLRTVAKLIKKSGDIVVAPEVVLTGFCYERFEEAAAFSQKALETLLPLSKNRVICYTQIEKKHSKFYNMAKVLYQEEVVYEQPKIKLFAFGGETNYFEAGSIEDMHLFEIDGCKIGLLICFELRFLEIWQRLQGSDLILLPAMWGKARKSHFEVLSRALAIMNQCFVIASDSANSDMAKGSGIITPFGKEYRDDRKALLNQEVDLKEIGMMRRYMNIGLR